MKIVDLHIYGYGQLENMALTLADGVQLFYGENEAGKSTIMAFIHAMLFGFPTKQQSELRYEPKHHAKYGGRIRIFHEKFGFTVIERVKGKAAGDVTVTLEDGTTGGEELLKQLLSNIDKTLFQSIFSFNLHGLQHINQMKKEEIGKFLFSTGALGTDKLSFAEAEIKKELESRFKPGGKVPALNAKLNELNLLGQELKKAASKNLEYENLVQSKESILKEISILKNSISAFQEEKSKLYEWKKIEPLVREELTVVKELGEAGAVEFPPNGIERLERLKEILKPYQARHLSTEERVKTLEAEVKSFQPDEALLQQELQILSLLERLPLYEQLKHERKMLEDKLLELDEALSAVREKLHLPLSEDEITAINTNIFIKEQAEDIQKKQQRLHEAKQELDERFQDEKESLEEIEEDLQLAKSKILPERERKILEEKVMSGTDVTGAEAELKTIREQKELFEAASREEKVKLAKQRKDRQLQILFIGVLLSTLILYGIFKSQLAITMIGAAGILLYVFFLYVNRNQTTVSTASRALEALKLKESELIEKLQSADTVQFKNLQEKIALDDTRREQLRILQTKWEQQNTQYEKVIVKYEKWEAEATENKQKLLQISSELKIPEYIAKAYLFEAFQLIEQFKAKAREKYRIKEKMALLEADMEQIASGLKDLASRHLSKETGFSLQKSAFSLREKLKLEQEKQIQYREKQKKLQDLQEDLEQLTKEKEHLEQEGGQLLFEAQAVNEEQFYLKGKNAELHEKLIGRLREIRMQLDGSFLSETDREKFINALPPSDALQELNIQEEMEQQKLARLQETLAEAKYEIQLLEDGGIYSELLHRFKQKKFEFEEEAKEWAQFSLAQDVLARTIEKYKNIHLPRMLSKAEEFLMFLTDGRYRKILLQKSGTGFLIERKDHILFEANELSQATAEQVYVSLRLAVALTLYEKFKLPIIIDDSFVNFDRKRTKKIIELINQLKDNQVLFFTCHLHLLEWFQAENIITLNEGKVKIS